MKFIKLLLFSLTFINLNCSENLLSRGQEAELKEIDIYYEYLGPDYLTWLCNCGKAIKTSNIKLNLKRQLSFKELKTQIMEAIPSLPKKCPNLSFKFFQANSNNVNCITYQNDNDVIDLESYQCIEVIHPDVEARLRSR